MQILQDLHEKYFQKYSCHINIGSIILSHNKYKHIRNTNERRQCNCRSANCCSLNNCLEKKLIYKAKIMDTNGVGKTYIGMMGDSFNEKYTQYLVSFRDKNYKIHATSCQIWTLSKGEIYNPQIE